MSLRRVFLLLSMTSVFGSSVSAGPPFVSDDPEPTDYGHYEIYLYSGGSQTALGNSGASGVDFNYGAAPDLQLTAVLPLAYDAPDLGPPVAGIGNIELAAKYKLLHQSDGGWDVAVFPRLFLPSGSALVGQKHLSLLLPVWLEKDWGSWSTFGGGGCVLSKGGGARNFCMTGWALTRQLLPDLQFGGEFVYETADAIDGRASTGVGVGAKYDFSERYHLLAYAGRGLQNTQVSDRVAWYSSFLFTF